MEAITSLVSIKDTNQSYFTRCFHSASVAKGKTSSLARDTFTFFDVVPQLVLAGAFLKGVWKLHWTSAEIPEQDPKGVHVNRVIVLSCGEKTSNRGFNLHLSLSKKKLPSYIWMLKILQILLFCCFYEENQDVVSNAKITDMQCFANVIKHFQILLSSIHKPTYIYLMGFYELDQRSAAYDCRATSPPVAQK